MRVVIRRLLSVLIILLIPLLMLEGLLNILDPLGVRAYYDGIIDRENAMLPAPHGYSFAAGQYHWQNFDATITAEHWRLVPDSRREDCVVAFVGDSFTFGLGVDDADTFVNQLAPALPARLINAGLPGYNAENVAEVIESLPVGGYVYLLYDNDDEARMAYYPQRHAYPPALYLYWQYALLPRLGLASRNQPVFEEAFWQALARIYSRENLLVFGFADSSLAKQVEARYSIHLIAHPPGHVSAADAHPDADAHVAIARDMQPLVTAFVKSICEANHAQ